MILYSENRFFFRPRRASDFTTLQQLQPRAISHLTHLLVCLSFAPCGPLYPNRASCGNTGRPHRFTEDYDEPVIRLLPKHQPYLQRWCATIQHILSHARQEVLQLDLVCDVESFDLASMVLQPLSQAHNLADCSIRLSPQQSPVLRELARSTALRATGGKTTLPQFQFSELPREIQLQILEYTDLVTPLREVEWTPGYGYYVRIRDELDERCPCYFNKQPGEVGCIHQFGYCWEGTTACFCRRYHAAYSRTCKCWAPPQALFLVSHRLREVSEEVFFSRNRIVINPIVSCFEKPQWSFRQLEASTFLTMTRPSALSFIRNLELVFPPVGPSYFEEGGESHLDWVQATAVAKDKLNLPKLTLRISMAPFPMNGINVTPYHVNLDNAQGIEMLRTYLRLLQPFSAYTDAQRIFLRLAWPWQWVPFARAMLEQGKYRCPGYHESQTSYIEQLFGLAILGKHHDRLTAGKATHPQSQWRKQDEYHACYGGNLICSDFPFNNDRTRNIEHDRKAYEAMIADGGLMRLIQGSASLAES